MMKNSSILINEDHTPPPSDLEAGQAGIQSVEVGMRLLTLLAELTVDGPPPMLKTLAAAADMPPAKVHRYLVSLARTQFVERDLVTGRHRLGPMARQIGISSIRGMDVVKIAGARMSQICAELEQSVALAIWTYHGPAIVVTEDVRSPITIGTRVGEVMPLLSSATGRVFGAWMPQPLLQRLISHELGLARRDPSATIKTTEQVEQLFAQTREVGMGWTEGGMNFTVNALSAPVFDFRGAFVAALSALGPAHRFDVRPAGPLAQGLRAAAAAISHELGYQA